MCEELQGRGSPVRGWAALRVEMISPEASCGPGRRPPLQPAACRRSNPVNVLKQTRQGGARHVRAGARSIGASPWM